VFTKNEIKPIVKETVTLAYLDVGYLHNLGKCNIRPTNW